MKPVVSKLLALSLLVLGLMPFALGLQQVLAALHEQPANEAAARDQLQRLEASAAIAPSIQDLDVVRAFSGRNLLGKGPPAVLAAAIQERLRGMARLRGITILRASEIVAELPPPLRKVGLKLDMTGKAQVILAFAEDIEKQEPWLAIETAALRSGFIDTSPQQSEPLMTASFEIWGWASLVDEPK
jgi:Type II secretion system (T2SS), protein M subtype b